MAVPADVTVFSRNPADTCARHQVERVVDARVLTRRKTLLAISAAGVLDGKPERGRLAPLYGCRQLGAVVARVQQDPRSGETLKGCRACRTFASQSPYIKYRCGIKRGADRMNGVTRIPAATL